MAISFDQGLGNKRIKPVESSAITALSAARPPSETTPPTNTDRCDVLENPYAVMPCCADERVEQTITAYAAARVQQHLNTLIEEAAETPTSQFVAAFLLTNGVAASLIAKLCCDMFADWRSVDDYAGSTLLGGALCIVLLHSGFGNGVVLAHRAWKSWRLSAESTR